jgi:hypothetical protein
MDAWIEAYSIVLVFIPLKTKNEKENDKRTNGKNDSNVNLDVLILLSAKGGWHSGRPRSMMRCSSAPVPGILFLGAVVVRCDSTSVISRTRSRDRKSIPTTDLGGVFFVYLFWALQILQLTTQEVSYHRRP